MGNSMEQRAYPGEVTDENIKRIFSGAGDFTPRQMQCGIGTVYTYYIDGLTSGGDIADFVFKPLFQNMSGSMEDGFRQALRGNIYCAAASECKTLDDVAGKLVNGFCVVLFPEVGAVAYEVRTPVSRTPASPEVENTVKGPKDSFVETMRINTSLIRRHLRTPELRLYETKVGRRSLTNVSVAWVAGITNDDLVEKMKSRLDQIDIDGMLSPAAVEEYVTGSRATAFPLLQYTERTDTFCKGLLEGRVGLLVDGLPLAYLAPVDLGYLMDSPEDQGRDFITASLIRMLRYLALATSLLLPGLYIAIATHHQALIPLPLLRTIIESKQAVPFSTTSEVLGLLIAFELLQESGVHLPQAVGQSVSVIGGIVVGSAAVEAGLISPVALIIVSIAGVCGFVLPNRDLAEGVRVWRSAIAVLAALAGFGGVLAGILCLGIHLMGLKSMGIPYLRISRGGMGGILRPRLKKTKTRDKQLKPKDGKNQK